MQLEYNPVDYHEEENPLPVCADQGRASSNRDPAGVGTTVHRIARVRTCVTIDGQSIHWVWSLGITDRLNYQLLHRQSQRFLFTERVNNLPSERMYDHGVTEIHPVVGIARACLLSRRRGIPRV